MESCENADKFWLALVGMPASGKTEATYILKEEYGFESFRLSVIVRDEVRARRLDPTIANLEEVARDLRAQFGNSVVVVRAVERLRCMASRYCCIDGIRSLTEINALREYFPELVVLAIHASPRLRLKRSRTVRSDFTAEEFDWRDQQNLELGLGDAIARADFMLVHNDNSRVVFKRDLTRVLKKICHGAKQPWPPHRKENGKP